MSLSLRNYFYSLKYHQKFMLTKSLSTAELRNFTTEPAVSKPVKEPVVVSGTKEVTVNHDEESTSMVWLQHPLIKKLQSKAVETNSKLISFARGPLRSNLLVSIELVKLISAEQRLIPSLSTWPQAKESYISTFNSVKSAWEAGRINFNNVKEMVKDVTWGQVGRTLRISAEMASFYYIGELFGMLISFPFK